MFDLVAHSHSSIPYVHTGLGMEGLIGDIPWCIGFSSEKFGLISLDDSYVRLSSTSP